MKINTPIHYLSGSARNQIHFHNLFLEGSDMRAYKHHAVGPGRPKEGRTPAITNNTVIVQNLPRPASGAYVFLSEFTSLIVDGYQGFWLSVYSSKLSG